MIDTHSAYNTGTYNAVLTRLPGSGLATWRSRLKLCAFVEALWAGVEQLVPMFPMGLSNGAWVPQQGLIGPNSP